jgi:hypothetical protein
MLEPFEGPLLKLRRGREHIKALSNQINAYTLRLPIYRNAWNSPSSPGYIRYEIVLREIPPASFALVLGDAIHNLRVSLDLLAGDLVELEKRSRTGVYFPFASSAADLAGQIKSKNFHRAAPEAVVLLQKIAPYPGGDNLLRGLHDLDVIDKHKMITPTISHVRYIGGGVGIQWLDAEPRVVSHGEYFAPAYSEFGPDAFMTGEKLPVIFDLIFPFGGPFDSLSVQTTLTKLADHVLGVMNAFSALYGRTLNE